MIRPAQVTVRDATMMRMDEKRLPGSTPLALNDLLQAITALTRQTLPGPLPRVIWQHKREDLPCRIVQISPVNLEAEQRRGHDAMGTGAWEHINWEGGWIKEALLEVCGVLQKIAGARRRPP